MKTSLILSEGRQELILEPETSEEDRALAFLLVQREPKYMIVPYRASLRHGGSSQALLVTSPPPYSGSDPLRPVAIRISAMPPEPATPSLKTVHGALLLALFRIERNRRTPGLGPVLKRKDLDRLTDREAAIALCNELLSMNQEPPVSEEMNALCDMTGQSSADLLRKLACR